MAKKKLSRDQKRKQKKRKRLKPRRPLARSGGRGRAVGTVKPVDPAEQEARLAAAQADYAQQKLRLQAIFAAPDDQIPLVTEETLQIYLQHLRDNLTVPCLLTGIESLGYFSWEERYSFGYGSQAEYQRLRQTEASFRDQYELKSFAATVDLDWDDIVVAVSRTSDGRKYTIPLSELQAVDKSSAQYQYLHDYTVWRVNWQ